MSVFAASWEQSVGAESGAFGFSWKQIRGSESGSFGFAWEQSAGAESVAIRSIWEQKPGIKPGPIILSWLQNEGSEFIAEFSSVNICILQKDAFDYISGSISDDVDNSQLSFFINDFESKNSIFFDSLSISYTVNDATHRITIELPVNKITIGNNNAFEYISGKISDELGETTLSLIPYTSSWWRMAKVDAVDIVLNAENAGYSNSHVVIPAQIRIDVKSLGGYIDGSLIDDVESVNINYNISDFKFVPFALLPSVDIALSANSISQSVILPFDAVKIIYNMPLPVSGFELSEQTKRKSQRIYYLIVKAPADESYIYHPFYPRKTFIPNTSDPDIYIPCDSISITKNVDSPSSVRITARNYAPYIEQLTEYLGGWLLIYGGWKLSDGSLVIDEIMKSYFENMEFSKEPGNDYITISGHMWIINIEEVRKILYNTFPPSFQYGNTGRAGNISDAEVEDQFITDYFLRMKNPTIGFINYDPYKSVDLPPASSYRLSGGLRTYTINSIIHNVMPGDTVTIDGDTFEAGVISYNISAGTSEMTVTETEFPQEVRIDFPVYIAAGGAQGG